MMYLHFYSGTPCSTFLHEFVVALKNFNLCRDFT